MVRKQYIFTIFLSRIFQEPEVPWVLLGGNALLIRTGGGRFTKDVDLARDTPWGSPEDALAELRHLSSRSFRDDPFEFELQSITAHRETDPYGYGVETAKVQAQALLGGRAFEGFSIDLTTRRHLDAPIDQVLLKAVIDHETLQNLPTVPTTPIEHHLADKICALYERHGPNQDKASTRYRDLADVVRIVTAIPFDAARLATVLEREVGRRRMTLPDKMQVPAEDWVTSFPKAAAAFAEYPRKYWNLAAALEYCSTCLNEVLNGERDSGTWNPQNGDWR